MLKLSLPGLWKWESGVKAVELRVNRRISLEMMMYQQLLILVIYLASLWQAYNVLPYLTA